MAPDLQAEKDPRIPARLLSPRMESHVLILEGGKGGDGGPGGVQAPGNGGSGGSGEGSRVYITAQNVTNMHPSPAVVQASLLLNHCPPASRIFQGRQFILDAMHEFFAKATETQHIYVLYGLGGAGKTQVALKFIEQFSHFTDRFLVDASSTDTIETGLKNIVFGKQIGNSPQDGLRWLTSCCEAWLLFFDNADDPKINLNRFFPKRNHGNIIITSRNPNLKVYGAHSQISDMEEADAIALLLKSAAQEISIANELLAAKIAKVLWYLPLTIVQAGAFISESGAFDTYLLLYATNQATLLREKPVQSHDEYVWTVYTTWQMSFNQLSWPAAMFLQLCSFLHHDGISEDIFSRAADYLFNNTDKSKDHPRKRQKLDLDSMRDWPEPPSPFASMDRTERAQEFLRNFLGSRGEWEPLRFLKLTNEIKAYSLINYDPEQKSFSIHPLVHEWCRTTLDDLDSHHLCIGDILGMSIGKIPSEKIRLASLSLVSHVDALMQPEVGTFGLQYARIYRHAGRYTAAKALEEAVLKNQRTLLSNDHPDVLVAMHNLAHTYRHLGQYTKAEKLQFALLDKQKTRLGDDHFDTLLVMANLAITYDCLGRFQEAEKLQFVVLEKWRKLLGDDHPDTLCTMNNLASTYDELGQTAEAEKLKVMVLEKRRKLLGDDHLDTLQAMRNLAITYDNLGLLKDAEKLKLVVLEKRRKFLGDDHLDTLWVMHSLASTYDNFG
ncbi:P-loop containing nucleoside triphosphate hydrolase protein [Mycena galopus ATCC 62051]|nr:P-loop containing nucleoside triphosphate hydrolase protein [Mycena galopus ATCC 62051]